MSVTVRRWSAGAADGYGGVLDTWGAAESFPVDGWAPAGSSEPKTVGLNRVVVDRELFAPAPLHHKDRVTIGGEVFDVEGEAEDWTQGPFGFTPGFVINLVAHRG